MPELPMPMILIVDDDAAIRRMLQEILSLEGYHAEEAENGREALNRLGDGTPRVILLDLLMPILDGRGVIDALRATPGERHKHVIVLASAFANLEHNRDLDADGILAKPFTMHELIDIVNTAVHVYESREKARQSKSRDGVPTVKLAKRLGALQRGHEVSPSVEDEHFMGGLLAIDGIDVDSVNGVTNGSADSGKLSVGLSDEQTLIDVSTSADPPSKETGLTTSLTEKAIDLDRFLADSRISSSQATDVVSSATPISSKRKRSRWFR